MDWQPIETAPKNGTLWVGHASPFGPWGMEPVRWREGRGWVNIYTEEGNNSPPIDWTPTHWMPLPKPPIHRV